MRAGNIPTHTPLLQLKCIRLKCINVTILKLCKTWDCILLLQVALNIAQFKEPLVLG